MCIQYIHETCIKTNTKVDTKLKQKYRLIFIYISLNN